MLIAFSVAPSGTGEIPLEGDDGSVAPAVAAALRVVEASGLPYRLESMFTTLEGEWDECLAVIKEATDVVAAYGSRVSLVMKADIRPGRTGQLTAKVERVQRLLEQD